MGETFPRWPQRRNAQSTFLPQPPRRCGDEPCPGQPLHPSQAPFVYRALCLRQTDRVCFSSSRSAPPPPFFPGSWNALLTLPFPEGLRPCSLPGNWVCHTWAGVNRALGTPPPLQCLGTGMLGHVGEWGFQRGRCRAAGAVDGRFKAHF